MCVTLIKAAKIWENRKLLNSFSLLIPRRKRRLHFQGCVQVSRSLSWEERSRKNSNIFLPFCACVPRGPGTGSKAVLRLENMRVWRICHSYFFTWSCFLSPSWRTWQRNGNFSARFPKKNMKRKVYLSSSGGCWRCRTVRKNASTVIVVCTFFDLSRISRLTKMQDIN